MCALVTGVQTCALPILVDGAPGHGEGHNSGQAMNIVAALAVKDWMVRTNTAGTLVIWPGVAEELLGGKARFVRAGVFKDVDAAIFSHVSSQRSEKHRQNYSHHCAPRMPSFPCQK